jgi:hypothetical protein
MDCFSITGLFLVSKDMGGTKAHWAFFFLTRTKKPVTIEEIHQMADHFRACVGAVGEE